MSEAHQEKIICPSCKAIRLATVVHTRPFYSYAHECECGYIIMESDWEKANEDTQLGATMASNTKVTRDE